MKETIETASVVLSITIATFTIWRIYNSILRRLVVIQMRLDSLKGLAIALRSRTSDLEKFASVNHGYHIRGAASDIEEAFLDNYEGKDTGF
ncbi:hypothetical protein QUB63_16990 [Microcoleus sp. ARI1-B5]|uniref:hypothetical protein n=1 Tax=unclassified Microcoleus TaxID=2642155 RepID=UPI002FD6E408